MYALKGRRGWYVLTSLINKQYTRGVMHAYISANMYKYHNIYIHTYMLQIQMFFTGHQCLNFGTL